MQIKNARISGGLFSNSSVDIVIPFYKCYDKVAKLVESIWSCTRSNPYRICLVDDASPNADFIKNFNDKPLMTTVRSEKRLGFGGALKLGYDSTNFPWVIFLNSDCEIQEPSWMIEMGRSLLTLKNQGVRMISARTNNPCGSVYQKGEKRTPVQDLILEKDFLTLYCVMCHRDLFKHVGGFFKCYFPCGYEDEEIAFRIRKYGFKQAVCGRSWVYHEGYATVDLLCKEDQQMIGKIEENRDLCIKDISLMSHK
jgi:O-antigen biosynthesis protein